MTKITLKPIQRRILLQLAKHRQMDFNSLAEVMMPDREMPSESRARLKDEIRLQIDLLGIYHLVCIEERMGVRVCTAPGFVIAWADAQVRSLKQPKPARRTKSARCATIALPLVAATLLTTACTFPGLTRNDAPPAVQPYNADGTRPPERMEQFYNARSGTPVYRFCVGSECPQPTPKIPFGQRAVVTEIDAAGTATPVEQKITASLADAASTKTPPPRMAVPVKPQEVTAQNNKDAAKVVARLEEQRRTILEANLGIQAAGKVPTAQKASGKGMGVVEATAAGEAAAMAGMASVKPVPPAPAQEASADTARPVPAQPTQPVSTAAAISGEAAAAAAAKVTPPAAKPIQAAPVPPAPQPAPSIKASPLQDLLPSPGTRVPDRPQARLDRTPDVVVAAAPAPRPAIGAIALPAHEASVTVDTPADTRTPADFVAAWAGLWSAKDANAYFALYAGDFSPSYGDVPSLKEFERRRRDVMSRPGDIKVAVEVVKVEDSGDRATIRFWQSYESKAFRSRVLKALDLVRAEGDWKIRRERLIPAPQNPVA